MRVLCSIEKRELLFFKCKGKSVDDVPAVCLNKVALKRVTEFRYLGHFLTEDFTDVKDREGNVKLWRSVATH